MGLNKKTPEEDQILKTFQNSYLWSKWHIVLGYWLGYQILENLWFQWKQNEINLVIIILTGCLHVKKRINTGHLN